MNVLFNLLVVRQVRSGRGIRKYSLVLRIQYMPLNQTEPFSGSRRLVLGNGQQVQGILLELDGMYLNMSSMVVITLSMVLHQTETFISTNVPAVEKVPG